jgi:DNA-binding MarR family transcriptional regulator
MNAALMDRDSRPLPPRTCKPGEIIASEGNKPRGILLLNSGLFAYYQSAVNGNYRRYVLCSGPSALSWYTSSVAEINPYSVKALSEGTYTLFPPDISNVDKNQALKDARSNDSKNVSWQIATLRHHVGNFDLRIRDLFQYLPKITNGTMPTISHEAISGALGLTQPRVSDIISRLKGQGLIEGGMARSYQPFVITELGAESGFNDPKNLGAMQQDMLFWKQYAPTLEKRELLLEARQSPTSELRLARGLWLLTNGGEQTSPKINQESLARLLAMARETVNKRVLVLEDEGFLTRRDNMYSLTMEGRDFIEPGKQ